MKPLSFLGSILASTLTFFSTNTPRTLEPRTSDTSSMTPNFSYSNSKSFTAWPRPSTTSTNLVSCSHEDELF